MSSRVEFTIDSANRGLLRSIFQRLQAFHELKKKVEDCHGNETCVYRGVLNSDLANILSQLFVAKEPRCDFACRLNRVGISGGLLSSPLRQNSWPAGQNILPSSPKRPPPLLSTGPVQPLPWPPITTTAHKTCAYSFPMALTTCSSCPTPTATTLAK